MSILIWRVIKASLIDGALALPHELYETPPKLGILIPGLAIVAKEKYENA